MDNSLLYYLFVAYAFLVFGQEVPCSLGSPIPVLADVLPTVATTINDLRVNEILFGMVHNAMSSPSAGFYFFANHMNDPIVESLDAGYRGLSLDLCKCNGSLVFCHGGKEAGCGIGERDPIETFQQINEWITLHPTNVIMIWLQINESAGDSISMVDVDQIVNDVPLGTANRDFAKRLYQRQDEDLGYNDGINNNESLLWPTLSELIQKEQQILFFYMGGPDGTEKSNTGVHYFYEYGMSTHWSYSSVSDLEKTASNGCLIKRDSSSNRRDFFMVNNFVTKQFFGYNLRPSRSASEEINEASFLQPIVDACERIHRTNVNIISVDFWKTGNLIRYIDDHNSKLLSTYRPHRISSSTNANRPYRDKRTTSLQDYSVQPSYNKTKRSYTRIDKLVKALPAIDPRSSTDTRIKISTSSLEIDSYPQDNKLPPIQIHEDIIKQASKSTLLEESNEIFDVGLISNVPVSNLTSSSSIYGFLFAVALMVMTALSI